MEKLLAIAVAAALSPVWTPAREVKFEDLPPVCSAVYEPYLKELRNAVSTEVISIDMDKDGQDEMLVWDGNEGTGGQGWTLLIKRSNTWQKAGEFFGDVIAVPLAECNGILICSPCGWANASFGYYELLNGSLQKRLAFEIDYSKPVRKNPSKITVNYQESSK